MTQKVGLYRRTSTTDQDGASQLHQLLEAARGRGFADRLEDYADIGHSGAKASRPALDKMLDDARRGRLEAVIIVGLDRLGRSIRDLLRLFDELTAAGVRLISLREGIDLSTATGRLVANVFASIAEFERELIHERVRAGVARAQASGKHCGRPRNADAPEPAKVSGLRVLGKSWAQCAAELGCSVGAARRAVKAYA